MNKLFLHAYAAIPVSCNLQTYGAFLEESSLSALLTPAPMKDNPNDDSPLYHGVRFDSATPRRNKRELTLVIGFKAKDFETFLSNYGAFCTDILANQYFTLTCEAGTFNLLYKSCTQVEEWAKSGVAKFSLKVIEPNPLR